MGRNSCLLVFLLQIFVTTEATLTVGVGGGVWIGGGTNTPAAGSIPGQNFAYNALQSWKSAITDDPLGVLTTWVGPNVCTYKGIFCSSSQNYPTTNELIVTGIDLNHANLEGTFVKELSFLTHLSLIHLNSNRFSGIIPDTFRDLTYLTELDLSNNKFSGPFPTIVLLIPNLIYLDLRFNSFTGPIPEDLFNKKLDAIFLNNNKFDGELPQSLGNSPASVINFANNKFSGTIPFSLGYMGPRIKEILFLNNQLNGCIPEGVGLWTDLQVLDVSFNSLMGHLPDTISCLSDVEVLNVAHNMLSGDLPDLVCSLRSLLNLSVAYNFFSGLSQDCEKRNFGIDLSLNCIPGRQMQRPQPECSMIPGSSLSCLRVPAVKPLVCGTLLSTENTISSPPSN